MDIDNLIVKKGDIIILTTKCGKCRSLDTSGYMEKLDGTILEVDSVSGEYVYFKKTGDRVLDKKVSCWSWFMNDYQFKLVNTTHELWI